MQSLQFFRTIAIAWVALLISGTCCAAQSASCEVNGSKPGVAPIYLIDCIQRIDKNAAAQALAKAGNADELPVSGNWFQIDLVAGQDEKLQFDLGMPDAWQAQVFLVQNGQAHTLLNLNTASVFRDRPVLHRELLAPFQMSAGTATLYIQYLSHGDTMVFGRLFNAQQFMYNDMFTNLFNGFVFGIMLIMIPILTLSFSGTQQINFRLYGLMVLTNMLFIAQVEGYLNLFFWPDSPAWNMVAPGVFTLLATMTHILFAMNFLRMKTGMPRLYRFHQILFGVAIVLMVLFVVLHIDTTVNLMMVLYPVVACVSAIQGIRQGIGAARFYFFGALTLLFFPAMLLCVNAVHFNPFPHISVLTYPKIGYLAETLLFGAAVISQMRQFSQRQAGQRILRMAETEQLLQAERDKIQAMEKASEHQLRLASVSHDIAQPLASLSFAISALSQQTKTETLTEHMNNTVQYAQTLLKDLLDRTRQEHLIPERIELSATFNQLEQAFAGVADQKGIRLSIHSSRLSLAGSPLLLYRILTNLLANAVRYTARGRVVLGARRRANGIEIMLYDTGPGMNKATEEVILQPFRQGGEGEGFGLGLFIVKNLCQQCGYQLKISSVVGRGSCFSVFIPTGK